MEHQQQELVAEVVEELLVNVRQDLEVLVVVELEEVILQEMEQLEQLIQVAVAEVWVLQDPLDNPLQYLEMVVAEL